MMEGCCGHVMSVMYSIITVHDGRLLWACYECNVFHNYSHMMEGCYGHVMSVMYYMITVHDGRLLWACYECNVLYDYSP